MKSKHSDKAHSRRNKKTSKGKKLIKIIVIILIITFSVIIAINLRKDKLYGTWTTDGKTIYKFNGKGKGSLVTSLSRYEFKYKIKNNKLFINYLSDKAKDASYEFSTDEEKIILEGIDQTKGNYIFQKCY